jgi:hypothetical protein
MIALLRHVPEWVGLVPLLSLLAVAVTGLRMHIQTALG